MMLGRRDLLARAGLSAAALALGGGSAVSTAFAADDPPKYPVLGSGEHTYEAIHDWLTPPDNIRYGDTHGLAQDSHGRIYLAHTVHPSSKSDDAICVFDESGRFLTSWGARFKGGAHGLDVRREADGQEYLYHCDIAHRQVVKTKLDGTVVWEKGVPTESGAYRFGAPYVPTNVAFGPDGGFYVADGYGSSWVHRYDAKGNLLSTFGGKGSDPGKLNQPHGLWLDDRGTEPLLVVADRANQRLQYFTLDGRHVRFSKDGMRHPCHFALEPKTGVMMVPDLDSVVTLLDRQNKVVVQLGDGFPSDLRGHPRTDFLPGKFIHPHDAIFLRNGDILVAEWVPIGRVTLLRKRKKSA